MNEQVSETEKQQRLVEQVENTILRKHLTENYLQKGEIFFNEAANEQDIAELNTLIKRVSLFGDAQKKIERLGKRVPPNIIKEAKQEALCQIIKNKLLREYLRENYILRGKLFFYDHVTEKDIMQLNAFLAEPGPAKDIRRKIKNLGADIPLDIIQAIKQESFHKHIANAALRNIFEKHDLKAKSTHSRLRGGKKTLRRITDINTAIRENKGLSEIRELMEKIKITLEIPDVYLEEALSQDKTTSEQALEKIDTLYSKIGAIEKIKNKVSEIQKKSDSLRAEAKAIKDIYIRLYPGQEIKLSDFTPWKQLEKHKKQLTDNLADLHTLINDEHLIPLQEESKIINSKKQEVTDEIRAIHNAFSQEDFQESVTPSLRESTPTNEYDAVIRSIATKIDKGMPFAAETELETYLSRDENFQKGLTPQYSEPLKYLNATITRSIADTLGVISTVLFVAIPKEQLETDKIIPGSEKEAYINYVNELSLYVIPDILLQNNRIADTEKTLDKETIELVLFRIERWIWVAHECLEKGDIASFMGILSALQNSAIYRLIDPTREDAFYDLLSKKAQQAFTDMEEIANPSLNYKTLQKYQSSHKNVRPLLPSLMKSITIINDETDKLIQDKLESLEKEQGQLDQETKDTIKAEIKKAHNEPIEEIVEKIQAQQKELTQPREKILSRDDAEHLMKELFGERLFESAQLRKKQLAKIHGSTSSIELSLDRFLDSDKRKSLKERFNNQNEKLEQNFNETNNMLEQRITDLEKEPDTNKKAAKIRKFEKDKKDAEKNFYRKKTELFQNIFEDEVNSLSIRILPRTRKIEDIRSLQLRQHNNRITETTLPDYMTFTDISLDAIPLIAVAAEPQQQKNTVESAEKSSPTENTAKDEQAKQPTEPSFEEPKKPSFTTEQQKFLRHYFAQEINENNRDDVDSILLDPDFSFTRQDLNDFLSIMAPHFQLAVEGPDDEDTLKNEIKAIKLPGLTLTQRELILDLVYKELNSKRLDDRNKKEFYELLNNPETRFTRESVNQLLELVMFDQFIPDSINNPVTLTRYLNKISKSLPGLSIEQREKIKSSVQHEYDIATPTQREAFDKALNNPDGNYSEESIEIIFSTLGNFPEPIKLAASEEYMSIDKRLEKMPALTRRERQIFIDKTKHFYEGTAKEQYVMAALKSPDATFTRQYFNKEVLPSCCPNFQLPEGSDRTFLDMARLINSLPGLSYQQQNMIRHAVAPEYRELSQTDKERFDYALKAPDTRFNRDSINQILHLLGEPAIQLPPIAITELEEVNPEDEIIIALNRLPGLSRSEQAMIHHAVRNETLPPKFEKLLNAHHLQFNKNDINKIFATLDIYPPIEIPDSIEDTKGSLKTYLNNMPGLSYQQRVMIFDKVHSRIPDESRETFESHLFSPHAEFTHEYINIILKTIGLKLPDEPADPVKAIEAMQLPTIQPVIEAEAKPAPAPAPENIPKETPKQVQSSIVQPDELPFEDPIFSVDDQEESQKDSETASQPLPSEVASDDEASLFSEEETSPEIPSEIDSEMDQDTELNKETPALPARQLKKSTKDRLQRLKDKIHARKEKRKIAQRRPTRKILEIDTEAPQEGTVDTQIVTKKLTDAQKKCIYEKVKDLITDFNREKFNKVLEEVDWTRDGINTVFAIFDFNPPLQLPRPTLFAQMQKDPVAFAIKKMVIPEQKEFMKEPGIQKVESTVPKPPLQAEEKSTPTIDNTASRTATKTELPVAKKKEEIVIQSESSKLNRNGIIDALGDDSPLRIREHSDLDDPNKVWISAAISSKEPLSYRVETPRKNYIQYSEQTNKYATSGKDTSIEHFRKIGLLAKEAGHMELNIELLKKNSETQKNAWIAFNAIGIKTIGYTPTAEASQGLKDYTNKQKMPRLTRDARSGA